MRIQMAELIEKNNEKGMRMFDDPFVAGLILQVWYLNGVLKRNKKKTAAEALPELVGRNDDSDSDSDDDGEKKPSKKPSEAPTVAGKAGASGSSAEVTVLSAKVTSLSSNLEKLASKVSSLDSKLDKVLQKLDKAGSYAT